MKHFQVCVALLVLPLIVAARDRLPIEVFSRSAEACDAELSPDGKKIAYLGDYAGRPMLHIADLERQSTHRLDLGPAAYLNNAHKDVRWFTWVSSHRLLVSTKVWDDFYGVLAVDADGTKPVPISGLEVPNLGQAEPQFADEVLFRFFDDAQRVLMLDRHYSSFDEPQPPDVLEVNTTVGSPLTVVKNPGKVTSWGVDTKGVVRLGILEDGDESGAIYRETEAGRWTTILPLAKRAGTVDPVGFDASSGHVFVVGLNPERRRTIFTLNPRSGELGAPLVTNNEYDILPAEYTPVIDGHSLATPVFAPKHDALIGVRYVTESPRVTWFDRNFQRMQLGMDRAAPNTVNMLIDMSRDGQRMLWLCFSDQDPGTYFLADNAAHTLKPMLKVRGWIKPPTMAPMLAIKYQARDGQLIHGFLTVPIGHQPKNLPLVVMPHGGPWVRDVWGYEPLVQLLANRGYAVLQMNYRGSPGYGDDLLAAARREIGGKIQDDIEDATRWAVAAGVADPKRIAIFGTSYGGYSALFALGHNPELYRCGVSYAGVTDWPRMYEKSDVAEYKEAKRYWHEHIGDPIKDREKLLAISPVSFADKITAPLLVIHGKEDRRVPVDQANRLIAALQKVGRPPQTLFLSGVAHNHGRAPKTTEFMKTLVEFLEKHLGPGVD